MDVDVETTSSEDDLTESALLSFLCNSPTDLECVNYMNKFTTVYGALHGFKELIRDPDYKVAFCQMVSGLVSHMPEAKRFAREWLPEYFDEISSVDDEERCVSAIDSIYLIYVNDEKYFASAIQWGTIAAFYEWKYLPAANRAVFLGRLILLTKADEVEKSVDLRSPRCVSFGARCLPPFESERCSCKKFESYVTFPSTTVAALEQITSAVLQNRPLLVQGPTGCGKSSIIRYFAHRARNCNCLVTIQASDQMDTKACFGSYHFTEIPGEFEWKLGPLALAASEGSWVLVEDINLAPLDFLQQLASILESGKIYLPGHSSVQLHPKFQLFATMRIENGIRSLATGHDRAAYLSMFPIVVDLPGFTRDQIVHIASSFNADASRHSSRYVQLLAVGKAACSGEESVPSIRKLFNYLKRIVSQRCMEDADGLFRNAMDCIAADIRSPEERKQAALSIGSMLNMSEATVDFNCTKYYPKVTLDNLQVRIGRATLPIAEDHIQPRKGSFATTRSASCLLEQIAVCVQMAEPVLLVGETGCGKTAAVQFLANITGNSLRVVNMSYQTETADLTGGYSPVKLRVPLEDLKRKFEQLFFQCFAKGNEDFFKTLNENARNEKWLTVLKMMLKVSSMALHKYIQRERWVSLRRVIRSWSQLLRKGPAGLAFQYTEGVLMKALQDGEWILLDEVNMASEELLSWLHVVIDCQAGDEVLLDAYKRQTSVVNKNFRLFACMNPATDVGKRELPVGLRSLFTEIYVDDVSDSADMHHLVTSYLSKTVFSADVVQNVVHFYQHVKQIASTELRSNSQGRSPCFNLRNLCRALLDANENRYLNKNRSLYEAFCLGFLTGIDSKSYASLKTMIQNFTIKKKGQGVQQPSFKTKQRGNILDVCGFPIVMGSLQPFTKPDYVLSKSVTRNLEDLCRVVSARRFPVLLQGETSVGKTSMIQFLAALTGNVCIRINNHQNTDLQDYTGSYISDSSGKFVFVEGPLVKAMRAGYWIILDELNLAEPDVLEALNRVLDDNRELFIPETQEVVTAHENFILFATQNPPGVYSGRKTLSRALRSRFVEINFNELPYDELGEILAKSSHLPPSYAFKMVAVMRDLQMHRSYAGCLSGRHSYITLRDMFRWGQRFRLTGAQLGETRDWDQFLADQGFFLLGGRSRLPEDEAVVAQVLEKHFRRSISPQALFSIKSAYFPSQILHTASGTQDWRIVWTDGLIRMAVLVYQALLFGEAVLMVGETGCAKTTLCQMLTEAMERRLITINCHMSTEAADFVGRLVPSPPEKASSGALFEWQDGCLVRAMKEGAALLIDEISLAEDSVLERLNSVLEPERTLILYEKCSSEQCSSDVVTAAANFAILATMNPGGDYGKRELSRALRNRFTEVWCEMTLDVQCSEEATVANLNGMNCASEIGRLIIKYFAWLAGRLHLTSRFTMRDVVTWIQFIKATHTMLGLGPSILHGGMMLLDSVALQSSCNSRLIRKQLSEEAKQFLLNQMPMLCEMAEPVGQAISEGGQFGISPFLIPIGPLGSNADPSYCLTGPTCRENAFRILRAITLDKPILLEGSPGVGKSSLVIAIAKASGYPITRINLSEHTDLNDLFGMDMPVVLNNRRQTFAWKDGPLLSAIKNGHWVLLDEMNLASQSVLEGLNSCFDHRGEIFIPELGRLFTVDRVQTRFFASQNPIHQGGSRKALPKSFLNRFVIIHLDELQQDDVTSILQPFLQCEKFNEALISRMVSFSMSLNERVNDRRLFGQTGGPWEFNVRDLIRLCQLVRDSDLAVVDAAEIIYAYRFRTPNDRRQLVEMACEIFGQQPSRLWNQFSVTDGFLFACDTSLERAASPHVSEILERAILLSSLAKYMRAMMHCINMDFLTILVGKSRVGKSMLVRTLAGLCRQKLNIFYLTADTDVTELLGCYEQRTFLDCFIDECLDEAAAICDAVISAWLSVNNLSVAVEVSCFVEEELVRCRKHSLDFCCSIVARVNHFVDDLSYSSVSEDVVNNFEGRVDALTEKLKKANSSEKGIRFEWIDSPLVKAIRSGEWILLENVNLCSSAVLERLNSLFEPDGELSVGFSASSTTAGQTTYKRDPKFRAFFTMNPDHGEIFRSVRNRGVEIFILDEDACFRDPIGSVVLRDERSECVRQETSDGGTNEQMDEVEILENKEPLKLLFNAPTRFIISRLNMLTREAAFSGLHRDSILFHCYCSDLKRNRDLLNISRRQFFYYSSTQDILHRVALLQRIDRDFLGGDGLPRLDGYVDDLNRKLTLIFRHDSTSDQSYRVAFDPRWVLFYLIFNWFHAVQFGKITSAKVQRLSHLRNMPRCWIVAVKQASSLLDYHSCCKKIVFAFGRKPFRSDAWIEAIMYLSTLYLCLKRFRHLQREQSTANGYVEFWMLLRQLDLWFQRFTTKMGLKGAFLRAGQNVDRTLSCERLFESLYDSFALKSELRLSSQLWNAECRERLLSFFELAAANKVTNDTDNTGIITRIKRMLLALKKDGSVDANEIDEFISKEENLNSVSLAHPEPTLSTVASILLKCHAVSQGTIDEDSLDRLVFLDDALLNPRLFTNSPSLSPDANLYEWLKCLTSPMPFMSALCLDLSSDEMLSPDDHALEASGYLSRQPNIARIDGLIESPVVTSVLCKVFFDHLRPNGLSIPIGKMRKFADEATEVMKFVWHLGAPLRRMRWHSRNIVRQLLRTTLDRIGAAIDAASMKALKLGCNVSELYENTLKSYSSLELDYDDVKLEKVCFDVGYLYSWLATTLSESLDPVLMRIAKQSALRKQLNLIWKELAVCSVHLMCAAGCPVVDDSFPSIEDMEKADRLRGRCAHPYFGCLLDALSALSEQQRQQQTVCLGDETQMSRSEMLNLDQLTRHLCDFMNVSGDHLRSLFDECCQPISAQAFQSLIYGLVQQICSIVHARKLICESTGYPDIVAVLRVGLDMILLALDWSLIRIVRQALLANQRTVSSSNAQLDSVIPLSFEHLPFPVYDWRPPLPHAKQLTNAGLLRLLDCGTIEASRYGEIVDLLRAQWSKITNYFQRSNALFEMKAESTTAEEAEEAALERLFSPRQPYNDQDEQEPAETESFYLNQRSLVVDVFRKMMDKTAYQLSNREVLFTSYWANVKPCEKWLSAFDQFDEHLMSNHVLILNEIYRSLAGLKEDAKENGCYSLVVQCSTAVEPLRSALVRLESEWPNNAILQDIEADIGRLLELPCNTTLQGLLPALQLLLGRVEQWDQVARRDDKLNEASEPLRALLIKGREQELGRWSLLLDDAEIDFRNAGLERALAFADIVDLCQTTAVPLGGFIKNFSVDIASLAVGHFISYVRGIQLLLRHCKSIRQSRYADVLANMCTYYSQYFSIVRKAVATARQPKEKELKDLIRIVKFNTLNWWALLDSVKHKKRQLFNIVKKYKERLAEPLSVVLSVGTVSALTIDDVRCFPSVSSGLDEDRLLEACSGCPKIFKLYGKLGQLLKQFDMSSSMLKCSEVLGEVAELCKNTTAKLRSPVGYGEKEKNEKLYKRELAQRQKMIAALMRTMSDVLGLSYRKGHLVSFEQMENAAFSMCINEQDGGDISETSFETLDTLCRFYWTCMSYWMKVSAKSFTGINDQVEKRTSTVMLGLSNLCMNNIIRLTGMLNAQKRPLENLRRLCKEAGMLVDDLSNGANVQEGRVCYELVAELNLLLNETRRAVEALLTLWRSAPEDDDVEGNSKWKRLAKLFHSCNPPIATWSKGSSDFVSAMDRLSKLQTDVDLVCKEAEQLRHMSAKNMNYCSGPQVQRFSEALSQIVTVLLPEMDELLNVVVDCDDGKPTFHGGSLPDWTNKLRTACTTAQACLQKARSNVQDTIDIDTTLVDDTFRAVQLFAQNLHKQNLCLREADSPAETISKASTILLNANIIKLNEVVGNFNKGLLETATFSSSSLIVYNSLHKLFNTLEAAYEHCHRLAVKFCLFYESLGQLVIALCEHGYVEPPPEEEAAGSGETKFENFENAGLGEGEGVKDVTDEIEDMGQLDDLKKSDELPEEQNDRQFDDVETPIDVDDDFLGNLEDLELGSDRENSDGDDNMSNSSEGGSVESVDDQFGDVDNANEDVLDPELWDTEEEEIPNLDQNNEAAQKPTNELGAKEEVNAAADQQNVEDIQSEDLEKDEENAEDNEDHMEFANEMSESEGTANDSELENDNVLEEEEPEITEQQVDGKGSEEDESSNVDEKQTPPTSSGCQCISDATSDMGEPTEQTEQQQDDHIEGVDQTALAQDSESESRQDKLKRNVAAETTKEWQNEFSSPIKRQKVPEEMKTVGDPSEAFKHDAEIDQADFDGANPIQTDGSVFAHSADLSEECGQVVDSATLDVVKRQNLEQVEHHRQILDVSKELNVDKEDQVTDSAVIENDHERQHEVSGLESEENEMALDDEKVDDNPPDTSPSTFCTNRDFYELVRYFHSTEWPSESALELPAEPKVLSAEDCLSIWTQFVRFTESLSVELCERLRAILVPTTASRLQGDYRTGKRLNIRKLIPFVASNFRQNKIWLRRTKRAKRSYQIVIAIDSSSSMMDNRAKQIAIESLALISNALRRLEVGSVAVCKFGESTELLSPLCDHFDDVTGAAVVQGLNFSELRTNVCNLLKCVPSFFSSHGDGGDFVGIDAPARLLIIVSDGRGVYAEGQDAMKQSIQELIQFGSSIFDVKVPTFKDNGQLDIVSYLEVFPFPFYIILKRISDLPGVVGDALCQWFQMVATVQSNVPEFVVNFRFHCKHTDG
ncbi:hypothetical protein M514_05069, partial [Trichuris suis]